MKADEVHSGRRHERGQLGQELSGRHVDVGGAIPPNRLETVGQLTVRQLLEALGGDRRSRRVPDQLLELVPPASRDGGRGMEGKSAALRALRRRGLLIVDPREQAGVAAAADGQAYEGCQGGLIHEGIFTEVLLAHDPATLEHPDDSVGDRFHQDLNVCSSRWRNPMKPVAVGRG